MSAQNSLLWSRDGQQQENQTIRGLRKRFVTFTILYHFFVYARFIPTSTFIFHSTYLDKVQKGIAKLATWSLLYSVPVTECLLLDVLCHMKQ